MIKKILDVLDSTPPALLAFAKMVVVAAVMLVLSVVFAVLFMHFLWWIARL